MHGTFTHSHVTSHHFYGFHSTLSQARFHGGWGSVGAPPLMLPLLQPGPILQ